MKKTLQLLIALFTFTFASAQFTSSNINYTITASVADGDATDEVAVAGSTLATVVVPNQVIDGGVTYTVTTIGTNAFNGNTTITTIELPNTVTSIGNSSFRSATELTTVSFTTTSGVTNLALRAFLLCGKLTNVNELFSTLQTTGGGSTNGNGALNGADITGAIVIPNLISTGTSILRANHNLTSVDLSGSTSLTNLNTNFIFDCDLVSEVLLPEGLVNMTGSCLRDLPALPSLTIPSTVTTIGGNAMTDNPLLKNITVKSTTPPTATGAFGGTTDITDATLTVPTGTKALYEETDVWKDFGTIQEETTLSIENVIADEFNISPNPVNDVINVEIAGNNTSIAVYDITGKLLLTVNGKQANVSGLASGVYIVKITSDNQDFVKRIIKK